MKYQELKLLSDQFLSDAIEIRHHLHMYPELSWQEELTVDYIKKQIQLFQKTSCLHLTIQEKKGGLIVDLDVDVNLPRILFRADIDALPIHEETMLPYSSLHPGVMHACGHDMHCAMLLTALKACCGFKLPLTSNLRFVFQRAEEVPWTMSGGESLVEEGVCDGIDRVFGLHVNSTAEKGVFYSHPHRMLSNPCHFSFEIKARGGHVCSPSQGSNAIDVATDIHVCLRNFIQNHVDANHRVFLVPSISKAGVACNVMPGRAEICYSLRNFLSTEDKALLLSKIQQSIQTISQIHQDVSIENFTVIQGFPVLENNEKVFNTTKDLLERNMLDAREAPSMYAGEDFAYYLQKKPGCFWMLGAKQGKGYNHHTSVFNPDESVMAQGILYWLLLATQVN